MISITYVLSQWLFWRMNRGKEMSQIIWIQKYLILIVGMKILWNIKKKLSFISFVPYGTSAVQVSEKQTNKFFLCLRSRRFVFTQSKIENEEGPYMCTVDVTCETSILLALKDLNFFPPFFFFAKNAAVSAMVFLSFSSPILPHTEPKYNFALSEILHTLTYIRN